MCLIKFSLSKQAKTNKSKNKPEERKKGKGGQNALPQIQNVSLKSSPTCSIYFLAEGLRSSNGGSGKDRIQFFCFILCIINVYIRASLSDMT